jgi:hypothetical protein
MPSNLAHQFASSLAWWWLWKGPRSLFQFHSWKGRLLAIASFPWRSIATTLQRPTLAGLYFEVCRYCCGCQWFLPKRRISCHDQSFRMDEALWVVCLALKEMDQEMQGDGFRQMLQDAVPYNQVKGVILSMSYIHDQVGVPRDLSLTSAWYFWASLKWGIDTLMVVYKSKK